MSSGGATNPFSSSASRDTDDGEMYAVWGWGWNCGTRGRAVVLGTRQSPPRCHAVVSWQRLGRQYAGLLSPRPAVAAIGNEML